MRRSWRSLLGQDSDIARREQSMRLRQTQPVHAGAHGAGITGIQVPGVRIPSAAAVWAAVIGLARLLHSPNGEMLRNGLWSRMLAAGLFSKFTRLIGSTLSVDGARPNEQLSDADEMTGLATRSTYRRRAPREPDLLD